MARARCQFGVLHTTVLHLHDLGGDVLAGCQHNLLHLFVRNVTKYLTNVFDR